MNMSARSMSPEHCAWVPEDAGTYVAPTAPTTVYFIEARTGCTCCQSDNFVYGPFMTKDEAMAEMVKMHDRKELASQYAPNGRYNLARASCEVLPDGRWIVGGSSVFNADDQHPQNLGHPERNDLGLLYEGETL